MGKVIIGREAIQIEYAHNIWSEKRTTGVLVGVALIALLSIAGIYVIYPLKGLGFSSIGWWMLGSAAILAVVEASIILSWIQQSEPELQVDKKIFANLDRFKEHERGYDFSVFPHSTRGFVALYLKDGTHHQFRVFKNNEVVGIFLENIRETHPWVQQTDLS